MSRFPEKTPEKRPKIACVKVQVHWFCLTRQLASFCHAWKNGRKKARKSLKLLGFSQRHLFWCSLMVDLKRLELSTSRMRTERSPEWFRYMHPKFLKKCRENIVVCPFHTRHFFGCPAARKSVFCITVIILRMQRKRRAQVLYPTHWISTTHTFLYYIQHIKIICDVNYLNNITLWILKAKLFMINFYWLTMSFSVIINMYIIFHVSTICILAGKEAVLCCVNLL